MFEMIYNPRRLKQRVPKYMVNYDGVGMPLGAKTAFLQHCADPLILLFVAPLARSQYHCTKYF